MGILHWLTGDDMFRLNNELKKLTHQSDYEFVDRLPDGASHEQLIQSVLGMSLLGGTKLIVAKDPQFLTQPGAPESLKCIDTICRNLPNEHSLVVVSTKSVDGRTKLAQILKKNAKVHEFSTFKEWEWAKIKEWTESQARSLGVPISDDVIDTLIAAVGTDTGKIAQVLDTLSVYGVGKSQVGLTELEAVMGRKVGSIFRLTEALRRNDLAVIAEELDALEKNNDEPVKLMGLVVSTLHAHWMTLLLMSDGGSFADIGSLLERHPYTIQKGFPELKRCHTVDGLGRKLLALSDIDIGFKSGRIAIDTVVPLMIAALQ